MAETSGLRPDAAAGPIRLVRFDRVQRAAHWANAVLFGVLLLSALALYFPSVERVVGRHVLVATIHLWAGIAWPVPLVVSLLGPWGARMRRDVRRFNRWTRAELAWLWHSSSRSGSGSGSGSGDVLGLEMDKFNPGQKLHALFVGGSIAVFLASGVVMKWFGLFPLDWRTGATFVHELLAFVIVVVVAGHVVMALFRRDALRSMVRGWVTVAWAQRHAPLWAREELGSGQRAGEPATDVRKDVPVSR
ncbi:MAG: cytochrome b/b6 domain-containing protein [Actinomycetota bacterium]|nr:cytochrome b/b6 domain-containing protein [Actinomycetota bacterium]